MKVAILGYTPTRKDAPYDDPEWEIWGLNDLYKYPGDVKRWTRWFEMHDDQLGNKVGRAKFDERVKEFAKWENIPIYMQNKHPDIPGSVAYPLEEMVKEYGDYFTNTISYMIALAIYEGAKEIGVYGVDMSTSEEYQKQRPSCEYYLGIAVGKGIKVTVHPEADLLKTRYLYGYETDQDEKFVKKINHMVSNMQERKSQAESQLNEVMKVIWQYEGAIATANEIRKLWKIE